MGNCVTTANGGRGRNGSSARFLREENLHLVPGRFFSNRISSSSSSSSSSIYSQQGLKGINQDAMILWEDFGGEGGVLCGVFDGHGPHGHLVARKVRDVLPIRLLSFLPDALEAGTVGASDGCCAVNITEPSSVNMRQALLRSYKAMDRHLRSHPTLDCFCSGTTAVVLLKIGSDLFLGNIGDSRAVLGSKDAGDDSMVAVQLTVDLKPDLPREAERIQRCRGRVFALQDEPEVQRVWLPFDDAPGLAMARAFGDFCLKDYGVISVPEFSHWTLTDMDRFVVLASDGVWDVLSNKEVVDIVSSSPTRSSAAQFLVDTATHEWKLKYPTSRMDDCSAVCLFLDEEMSPGSVSAENNCTAAYRTDGCFSNGSPNEEPNPEPMLDRNSTVRGSRATCMDGEKGADNMAEDQNTIRVDSLVKLPRFSDDGVAD